MAAAEISVKDSAASTNVAVEVIDAGAAPSAVTSGHAARQVTAIGDGGGTGQYAGVDSNSRLYAYQPDRTITGLLVPTSSTSAVSLMGLSGYGQAVISWPASPGTGSVYTEVTADGTNWFGPPTWSVQNNLAITSGGSQYMSVANTLRLPIMGYQGIRLRATGAGTSSGINVTITASSFVSLDPIQGNSTNIGTVTANLPTGTTTIGGLDNFKATYSASYIGLAGVAGDVVVLGGAAGKLIRLRRVLISGIATSSTTIDMQLIKRTTADTSGTAVTAASIVASDGNDATGSATLTAYSAAPTTGTSAGIIRAWKEQLLAAGSFNDPYELHFAEQYDKSPVLRGVAQQIALNMSSAPAGTSMNVTFVWTEE